MSKNRKISHEDLIDNMTDYLGDFIERLHEKDPTAVQAIGDNLEALQKANEELLTELQEKEEWTQEDMIELATLNLLLAASMGVPEVESDNDNDDDETSDTSETNEPEDND